MDISSDGVHYEFSRKIHWTRIIVKLDGGEATVLSCVSRNYIADQYRVQGIITIEHQRQWLEDVMKSVRNSNEEFVVGGVYRKVYAHTSEGYTNGLKFLTEEVQP